MSALAWGREGGWGGVTRRRETAVCEFQVTMGEDIRGRIGVLTGDVWVTSAETISATWARVFASLTVATILLTAAADSSSPLGCSTMVTPRYLSWNTMPSSRVSLVSVQFSGSSAEMRGEDMVTTLYDRRRRVSEALPQSTCVVTDLDTAAATPCPH